MLVKQNLKSNKGFILVEFLLAVVSVVLVVTLAFVAVEKIKESQRDSVRIKDLNQLITALDRYHADEKNKEKYPEQEEWECLGKSSLSKLVISGIISGLPADPLFERNSVSTGCYNYKSDGEDYKLRLNLESDSSKMEKDGGNVDVWYEVYTVDFQNE